MLQHHPLDYIQDPGLLQFIKSLEQVAHFPTEGEAILKSRVSRRVRRFGCSGRSGDWRFWLSNGGEKWGCYDEEAWILMIWVLGSPGKFNTAWCLIRDLHRSSMDTRRAMLIMIDRYASANDLDNAI